MDVAVNNFDFEKNQHFRVRFGEGGHSKAYAVYAFINVDNCERPLILLYLKHIVWVPFLTKFKAFVLWI